MSRPPLADSFSSLLESVAHTHSHEWFDFAQVRLRLACPEVVKWLSTNRETSMFSPPAPFSMCLTTAEQRFVNSLFSKLTPLPVSRSSWRPMTKDD
jgi:hypothetical protein